MNYSIPKPQIGFNPPVYVCKRATKPFHLDGNIDKEFWADAQFTADFRDIEGDFRPTPRFRTRAKMLWDDKNLYIAAELEGNEIWATVTERDDVIFVDNDFEIFIDPDSDTHHYYEFEMNALNTVWDLFLSKPYRDNGIPLNGWDIHGLQTAVKIDGELNNPNAENCRWSVEIVMPFEALKEAAIDKNAPVNGDYWRINFSRVQWIIDIEENKADGTKSFKRRLNQETGKPLPEDNWVWAPTGVVNIHYPELWAFVFFADKDENFSIPDDERTKWELRKLYYAQHAYRDEHGCFTDCIEKLTDSDVSELSPVIEISKHGFEISCQSKDEKREIYIFADGKIIVE